MKKSDPEMEIPAETGSEAEQPKTEMQKVHQIEPREGETACSSSAEVGFLHFMNTLYANSSDEIRQARISPTRIEESLKASERNRDLKKRGLG